MEAWNAQLSLLAGTAAAALMRQGGVGIFRTLPPAQQRDVERLRRTARALGIDWPQELPYADLIRSLDPAPAAHAAFLNEAQTLFRGAGYVAFDGSVPETPVMPRSQRSTRMSRRRCDAWWTAMASRCAQR